LAECESDGINHVRLKYDARNYPDFVLEDVRRWLGAKNQEERERNERSQAEQSRTARAAKNAAIVAAVAAVIAVPIAIISIIISALALRHPGQPPPARAPNEVSASLPARS
jgi:hypothetical protein